MSYIKKASLLIGIILILSGCGLSSNDNAITMSNPPEDLETEESLRSKALAEKEMLASELKEELDDASEVNEEVIDVSKASEELEELVDLEDEQVALGIDTSYEEHGFVFNEAVDFESLNYFDTLISSDSFISLDFVGEANGHYYYIHNYSKDNYVVSAVLSTNLNFENLKNIKKLDSPIQHNSIDTFDVIEDSSKYNGQVFKYNLEFSYLVFDENFELIEEVSLPEDILEASESDVFRTWDVSNDFNMITYTSDDKGLFLYKIEEGSLLHIGYNFAGNSESDGDVMDYPAFIMDDEFITTVRFGYEWTAGHNLYNIESGNFTILSNAVEETLYEHTGLYTYFLNGGIYGTYYDFDRDVRIERGIEYDFPMTNYDDDINILHKHYNLSSSLDEESKLNNWVVFDLTTKEEIPLFSYNNNINESFEVLANLEDEVVLICPFAINGSRLISIKLN